MNKYLIMPEYGRWTEEEAITAEMAYRNVCSWYNPNKKIAVLNIETKEVKIYSRKIDYGKRIVEIIEH